jgi:hypothetical protein
MVQQSILGRISQLARANINAMLDSAEDPEKMLDQMVRDYTANIGEAADHRQPPAARGRRPGGPRDGPAVGRQGGRGEPQGRRAQGLG